MPDRIADDAAAIAARMRELGLQRDQPLPPAPPPAQATQQPTPRPQSEWESMYVQAGF